MKHSKLLSIFLGVTLMISLLAGCGKSNEVSEPKNSESKSTSESEGKAFEGETLTVLYMSSVYAEAAKKMVPEFEEKTGAKVEVVDFPYVTLHEKSLLDLTSGTGSYDVMSVACQWDGEFAPYMEKLDNFIKEDNYDTTDFIPNVFENAGIWQGDTVGIPHANTPMVIAYRTDLIDKMPDTWDGYLELAKKFTKPDEGMYGVSIPGVKEQFAGLWDIRLWSMGGAWADENWNITVNSPQGEKAMEHVKELTKYADPAALSWGLEESIKAFLDGKAAICEAWPTLGITQNGDNPEKSKIVGKWALASYPREKTGETMLSAWDLSIPKASENKELAWEWIKMYSSKEKGSEFYKEFNILSPRESFWKTDAVVGTPIEDVRPALDTALIWWRVPASTEADTAVGMAVSSVMSGQKTTEEALKELEEGLKAALDNNPIDAGIKNTGK